MNVAVLRLIAMALPLLALVGALVAGFWVSLQVRSAEIHSRPDHRVAFSVAAVIGVVGVAAGGLVWIVGVGFAYMDSTTRPLTTYLAGVPVVITLGAVVALASLAGYVGLARTRLTRQALAGTVLGPLCVVALAVGVGSVVSWAGGAANEIETNQAAADLAARSSLLQVTVSDIAVVTTADGSSVTAVALRATVHATADVHLATDGKTAWPQFTLTAYSGSPLFSPTPAGPAALLAGSTTTYVLAFSTPSARTRLPTGIVLASTYGPAAPGTWALQMDLVDVNGADFRVTTDVVIKP